MTENTRSSELAKTIEESLLSFGFQGAKRKCYTPKYGKGAYIIEEWSAETLVNFIVDDLLAWHASKVEEAREDSYMRGYNDNARDCYCDSPGATEGVMPHKHLADDGKSHDIRPDIQALQSKEDYF